MFSRLKYEEVGGTYKSVDRQYDNSQQVHGQGEFYLSQGGHGKARHEAGLLQNAGKLLDTVEGGASSPLAHVCLRK